LTLVSSLWKEVLQSQNLVCTENKVPSFLGSETIEWMVPEFGFGGRWTCLDNSIDSRNESDCIRVFRSYRRVSSGVSSGVLSEPGMVGWFELDVSGLRMCDFGCADWRADDMVTVLVSCDGYDARSRAFGIIEDGE